mmetsp:Transcript_22306/g.69865  ORF Transcript_22306/g.69865 Transcript_22306/m.69865 type:complete len:201 (-) Transcript_22306:158-760(-)
MATSRPRVSSLSSRTKTLPLHVARLFPEDNFRRIGLAEHSRNVSFPRGSTASPMTRSTSPSHRCSSGAATRENLSRYTSRLTLPVPPTSTHTGGSGNPIFDFNLSSKAAKSPVSFWHVAVLDLAHRSLQEARISVDSSDSGHGIPTILSIPRDLDTHDAPSHPRHSAPACTDGAHNTKNAPRLAPSDSPLFHLGRAFLWR